MRLIGDEHVSPKIIRAVRELALAGKPARTGWSIESVIGSRYASTEDEDWIAAFATDGGQGLISADRRMLKRPTLITQIAETGVVGVYVQGGWANENRVQQAAHLLFWWPRIEETFATAPRGSAWIVPSTFDKDQALRECRPFGKPIASKSVG